MEGPEATRAAPPGPPVPVTTAGAAQRVEASEPIQIPSGAPWHRERRGVRPQDPWGAYTLLLQRGPRAREDLEGRCPADKEELGSAASRGSLPPPSALPPCPGNKEPFRTQGSPCPPSCLMPAHRPGISAQWTQGHLGRCQSWEPPLPTQQGPWILSTTRQARKEVGQQAGYKLDRKKNGLTLGVAPSRLGNCFLLSWLQEDPG